MTALTTEHFTLQGAGAATISESSSRSALYIKGHAATTIEILFTFASMIAVISSVILGAVLALAVASVFGAAPGVAIGAGGVSALGSILLHLSREVRVFSTVLFPAVPSERKPQRRRFHLR